jgi:hypothetical protein
MGEPVGWIDTIRRTNPITHQNREPIGSLIHVYLATWTVAAVPLHYLGNRYVWRWYSDGQLLGTHAIQTSSIFITRLASNLLPGKAVWNQGQEKYERSPSGAARLVNLSLIFAPMVVLPHFGQPALSFWGCVLGFDVHCMILTIPASILALCATAGVAIAHLFGEFGRALAQNVAANQEAEPGAAPPASTFKQEEPRQMPCNALFVEQGLSGLPPKYELDINAQFDLDRFVKWYAKA